MPEHEQEPGEAVGPGWLAVRTVGFGAPPPV